MMFALATRLEYLELLKEPMIEASPADD